VSLHWHFKNHVVERNVRNILDHYVWSTVILCGRALAHALAIVFSLQSPEFIPMEMDKVALGTIFLQHFMYHLPVIVPPVLRFWPFWFFMPQLNCSAEGLGHTLSVELEKIIDLNWEARCIKGVRCLSVCGHLLHKSWKVEFARIV
jgi:hypothetical protein